MIDKKELNEIQSYLEIHCSDNPDEVVERINTISVYKARTGFLLAEAKRSYREKRTDEIADKLIAIAKENYLSAKAQNAIIESMAIEEAYLVEWLDRINAACTLQIDALRSVLSYEKEHLRIAKTGY